MLLVCAVCAAGAAAAAPANGAALESIRSAAVRCAEAAHQRGAPWPDKAACFAEAHRALSAQHGEHGRLAEYEALLQHDEALAAQDRGDGQHALRLLRRLHAAAGALLPPRKADIVAFNLGVTLVKLGRGPSDLEEARAVLRGIAQSSAANAHVRLHAAVVRAVALHGVATSMESLDARMQQMPADLREIAANPALRVRLDDLLQVFHPIVPQHIAYAGVGDVVAVQRLFSSIPLAVCPEMRFTAPHVGVSWATDRAPRLLEARPAAPLRVGFVSSDFRRMTMALLLGGVLAQLPDANTHVTLVLVMSEDEADDVTALLQSVVNATLWMDNADGVEHARSAVAAQEFDVLIYNDLSFGSALSRLLATMRLAPAQALVFNNGQSSGLTSTMDAYISTALEQPPFNSSDDCSRATVDAADPSAWELSACAAAVVADDGERQLERLLLRSLPAAAAAKDARSYYTERVLYMFPPSVPLTVHAAPGGRLAAQLGGTALIGDHAAARRYGHEHYGLPAGAGVTLFACLQVMAKFHPTFDSTIARILGAVPGSMLVLLEGRVEAWRRALLQRWSTHPEFIAQGIHVDPDTPVLRRGEVDATLPLRQRVVFVPQLSRTEYLGLLGIVDVVLDPFPFGGGLSSHEAFIAGGRVVVTLVSAHRSGRLTAAMLARMGCLASVAATPREYAAIAARAGRDAEWRSLAEACVRRRGPAALLEHAGTLAHWRAFLRWAVRDAAARALAA